MCICIMQLCIGTEQCQMIIDCIYLCRFPLFPNSYQMIVDCSKISPKYLQLCMQVIKVFNWIGSDLQTWSNICRQSTNWFVSQWILLRMVLNSPNFVLFHSISRLDCFRGIIPYSMYLVHVSIG